MNMREVIIPGVTESQDMVMRFDLDKIIATCVTPSGDLIIKFGTFGNDTEMSLKYKDIDKANAVNDYIWSV